MSDFEVTIERIREVQDHPFADRLGVYKFEGNDLTVVVGLDNVQPVGTEMVFFPEHAKIPHWILQQNGFWVEEKNRGMLAGKEGDVVKPMKLRKVLSDGVAIPFANLQEAIDEAAVNSQSFAFQAPLAELLGVTKYESPVQQTNSDVAVAITNGPRVRWDVESAKKYSGLIHPKETVIATVKYHGSCGIFRGELRDGEFFFSATSKGQGKKGFWLDSDRSNWYTRAAALHSLPYSIERILRATPDAISITVIGEVYGQNVQKDWKYDAGEGEIRFRAFELLKNDEFYHEDYLTCLEQLDLYGIPTVEVVGAGQFGTTEWGTLTSASTTETPIGFHEGIVVRPYISRKNEATGDTLALKYISEAYTNYKTNQPIEKDIS